MFGEIKKLCTPAMIYFGLSVFTLFVMIISNIGNTNLFCMGNYDCPVDNIYVVYMINVGYLLFVTIVLDSLCKNGYAEISWFLVFFPIMFYFIALGIFMIMKRDTNFLIIQEQEY
jgi:hypothetical protein